MGLLVTVPIFVMALPYFRDNGRNILTSETSVVEALNKVINDGGASRFSSSGGGEFDTAVRLVSMVNEGVINPPGPIHFGHFLWGFVPRQLVPDKHILFSGWAGAEMSTIGSAASYVGCALTGWGESIAYLGGVGGIVYWVLLGWVIARVESSFFIEKDIALILAGVSFLPLSQYVAMGFWAGSMNIVYAVLPLLVGLSLSKRKSVARNR